MKKYSAIILLVCLALILSAATLYAQDDQNRGNISGRVYNDLDGNGVCAGTGEPGLGGVGIQGTSQEGNAMAVSTQADGNYQLTTVAFGTWTIRVVPGDDWRVTSSQERQVVVNADSRDNTGIDYCLTKQGAAVLPEGGAAVAPMLLYVAAAGIGLVVAGLLVLVLRRRVI